MSHLKSASRPRRGRPVRFPIEPCEDNKECGNIYYCKPSKSSSDVLEIRGKFYDVNQRMDQLDYLRAQSIPRRIQRLIGETSKNMKNNDTYEQRPPLPQRLSLVNDVAFIKTGINNKHLLEKRRGLHLKRSIDKSEVT